MRAHVDQLQIYPQEKDDGNRQRIYHNETRTHRVLEATQIITASVVRLVQATAAALLVSLPDEILPLRSEN